MNFEIKQVNKNFTQVCFYILDENQYQVGQIDVNSGMMPSTSQAAVSVWDRRLYLNEIPLVQARFDNPYQNIAKKPFEVFDISGDLGGGRIFYNEFKHSFASRINMQTMCINNCLFEVYKASFGKQGSKGAIYCNKVRIANIYKGYKVIDDVHNYTVEMLNDNYLLEVSTIVTHWYLSSHYSKDQTIKGVHTTIMTTRDKDLLDKVN